jgi:hypothetical protein
VSWLRRPSTTGGLVYLLVAGTLVVGTAIVAIGSWRTGVGVMGIALAVAFVARAVLPDERAGMLRIRRRFVDLTTLAVCAAGMFVLVAAIPNKR